MMIVMNAAAKAGLSSQSIYLNCETMKIPTKTNAMDVTAYDVINTLNIGYAKMDTKNKIPTTTDDKPVRAPDSIPELDSI